MKVQSLAVIFAIIVLPIVIILSYYIHGEVDTIVIQTSYDTKLIDSTHDAMSSFEINTANEDLSSVADSLRSIIEASCNVFMNTLATNLGISNAGNAAVDGYIPALLYTLYDGYYIYAPTRIPEILTDQDGRAVVVGDEGVTLAGGEVAIPGGNAKKYRYDPSSNATVDFASVDYELGQMLYANKDGTYSSQLHTNNLADDTKYKEEHILKSFMPYSARYKQGADTDIMINYTLDNYITVEGNVRGVYYSKTGYLISRDTVTSVDIGGVTDILTYNEISAEDRILSGEHNISLSIDPIVRGTDKVSTVDGNAIVIEFSPQLDDEGNPLNYTQMQERLIKLYEDQDANIGAIQDLEYALANLSAINYYVKAQIFSNWIYDNLGTLRACDISNDIAALNDGIYTTDSKMDIFHNFKLFDDDGNLTYEDQTIIFDGTRNPEIEDSPFYTHKLEVIRNNIQYNLNLAISSYNEMIQARNVQMPVISESEWEQILTRVSIVSFMQGLNCGMKTYNNYAIASSTNNELTVIPTEIYYTTKNQYNKIYEDVSGTITDTLYEYHKIDCDGLALQNADGSDAEYISFTSKEVKYDKIYDKASTKYIYDHRNLGCYRCAISSNYEKDVYAEDNVTRVRGYSDDIKIALLPHIKKKAYYVAIGKERQNLYKTNAITDSNGFEVFYTSPGAQVEFTGDAAVTIAGGSSKRNVSDLRAVEITLSDTKCDNASEATVNFKLCVNGAEVDHNIVINLDQKKPQTMVVPVHLDSASPVTNISLKKITPSERVECKRLNVTLIYE